MLGTLRYVDTSIRSVYGYMYVPQSQRLKVWLCPVDFQWLLGLMQALPATRRGVKNPARGPRARQKRCLLCYY